MEKLRSKIFACFLALALVLLTTPIGLKVDAENGSIELQANRAHAVAPSPENAVAFLADIARSCGLSVSELIATVAGISAAGIGMGIANATGINYGESAANNLDSLIDAADYPPWDTLSDESKESWGSKEYYDTAKFNSLLDAFGLGDARQRFYSSGGSGIDYTENELAQLQKIGRIGSNWINGISNTIGDINSLFGANGKATLRNSIGLDYKLVNGEDYSNWPTTAPAKIYVNQGTNATVTKIVSNNLQRDWFLIDSSSIVYITGYYDSSNRVNLAFYSKEPFTLRAYTGRTNIEDSTTPSTNKTLTVETKQYNGQNYYLYSGYNSNVTGPVESSNVQLSGTITVSKSVMTQCYEQILFGESLGIGEGAPIIGYPDNLQDDEPVYFPDGGISPMTEWVSLTTQPDEQPDTGDEDIAEIIRLLKQFHFTAEYDLLVHDKKLRTILLELVSIADKFKFYNVTGELKVHDAGVYEALGHAYSLMQVQSDQLGRILERLNAFFITDTASDVIGDFEFPELEDRALDLVDTISTLAPFGAMLMISEVVSILSQVGKIQKPELSFDFGFMPGHTYPLVLDLSWMDQMKPLINIVCITTLILGLMGVTARLVELEAAA